VLGRTKKRVPILGYGTAPLGSDNTSPEAVERILTYALERGVTYFDTAPVYGDPGSRYGNAEMKMKGFLQKHRQQVFLVTKVNAGSGQTKDGVLRMLEKSLKDLGTDHADAVHIHNLGDWDMNRLFSADGALAALRAAREQGLLRYTAVSGHMRPARFVQVIETGEIDLTMVALNFADRHTYDFEGLALPAARKQGTAVVAMKVLGGAQNWRYDAKTPGTLAQYYERAIRYSLGIQGVSCAVIGFANEEEIDKALAVIRDLKPLSAEEKAHLLAEGRQLAAQRGLYYGPVTG
jgi:hypothetical protein